MVESVATREFPIVLERGGRRLTCLLKQEKNKGEFLCVMWVVQDATGNSFRTSDLQNGTAN